MPRWSQAVKVINKVNPLNTKCRLLYLKTQFIPRSKHFSSRYKNQSVYDVSGTNRCLFLDKHKTHKYSVGGACSCWMLNCWCITWPVGFKRLMMGCVEKFVYDISESIYVLNVMKTTSYVRGLALVRFYPWLTLQNVQNFPAAAVFFNSCFRHIF